MIKQGKFTQSRKSDSFSSITLGLLSPEKILERSFGEVLKPETINYRSYKPEKDGLFCEKIFGPIKNWECNCGKYKGIRYRGIVCDRCGVEVTTKSVRRKRMGHITLAVPVIHIWFFRSIPSKISYLLGYTTKELEKLVYYEKYAVTNPGLSDKKFGDLIDEDEYIDLEDEFGIDGENVTEDQIDEDNYFEAKMGGEAVRMLLMKLDIREEMSRLSKIVKGSFSKQKKEESLKRLRIFKKFDPMLDKKIINQPEWMVLSVLPVIPPELRPLVPLDGGRFAASDLNDLYRRIIIRNNRLKQLMEIKAPDVILRNEKRMLQESVDSLLDNSRLQSAVRSGTRRPLKSLSDALKGKSGRFRQNLLGKRVDYSGRSVIVVGPELKLHECGIPKDMAIELFKPHIIRELINRGYTRTPRSAKLMVEKKEPAVYSVLEFTVRNNPVILNRAPTLHRLGVQAFQPILIEGRAIRLHPLVCAAFNADFDGDQMAVHVPLSVEAQMECWLLMLASHNILHPATGDPIAIPSQDMILGCYYLTRPRTGEVGENTLISSFEEAKMAVDNKEISLHAIVHFRRGKEWIKDTTIGRIIFNSILPEGMKYYNETIDKKGMVNIVKKSYADKGNYDTVQFLDRLKDLGFSSAFKSGLSIAISDIHIPKLKDNIIDKAEVQILDIKNKFDRQILTEGERYNKVIDVWTHATNEVAQEMFNELENDDQGFNALYMMADSGARGSQDQIKQLAGMRGLMAKPKKSLVGSAGEIIENPIKSNFKEGLSAFEYFISTHGARKGLADTALKTADAGYLTRRLVDVAQDVIISKSDCCTIQGVTMQDIKEGEKIIEPLFDRIIGRYSVDNVVDPIEGTMYIKSNKLISREIAEKIVNGNVKQIKVRSVLTCESDVGICVKCYGINLATTTLAKNGDAVGIMAAQSIGEPGTQLTLRTFHIGGTASRIVESSHMEAKKDGKIIFSEKLQLLKVDNKKKKATVAVSRNGKIELLDSNGIHITGWTIPYGAKVMIKNNEKVSKGDVLFSWDPYTDVILARTEGKVVFKDMIKGETFVEEAVEGGKKMILITESKNRNLSPHLEIETKKGDQIEIVTSILPVKATVIVKDGDKVKAGEILVKIPKDAGKTRDITGGLPRIAELFEARNPSNPAIISEIDGTVMYGKTKRGIKEIHVSGKSGEKIYKIPYGRHVLVQDKDLVFAGDRLSEGAVSPQDILKIRGSYRAQEYLVESIQEVYRLQQVSINDKHIEVIVRQMMHKVSIEDSGDSKFLNGDRIDRFTLKQENKSLVVKLVVKDPGESEYLEDDVVDKINIQEINKELKEKSLKLIKTRKCIPATYKPLLLGITRASLNTDSFISAASFQETTRVLTDAAVEGKTDYLKGLKENVIIGRLIPAGTGYPHAKNILVSKPEAQNDKNTKLESVKESLVE